MKTLSILILLTLASNSFAKDCSIVISNMGNADKKHLQYEFGFRYIHDNLNQQADYGIKLDYKDYISDRINPFGNPIIIKMKKFSLYEEGKIIHTTNYTNPEIENPLIEVVYKLRKLGCVVR